MGIHVSGGLPGTIFQSNGRVIQRVHLRIHCFGPYLHRFGTVLALFGTCLARYWCGNVPRFPENVLYLRLYEAMDTYGPAARGGLRYSEAGPGSLQGWSGWYLRPDVLGMARDIPWVGPWQYPPVPYPGTTPLPRVHPSPPHPRSGTRGHGLGPRPQRLAYSIKTVISGPPIYRQAYEPRVLTSHPWFI